jgi:hypothetical protein
MFGHVSQRRERWQAGFGCFDQVIIGHEHAFLKCFVRGDGLA